MAGEIESMTEIKIGKLGETQNSDLGGGDLESRIM